MTFRAISPIGPFNYNVIKYHTNFFLRQGNFSDAKVLFEIMQKKDR